MIQNLQNKQMVINALIPKLHDCKAEIRSKSAESLGKIGGKTVISDIASLLSDNEQIVKISAIEALGEIGDDEAIPHLINTINVSMESLTYYVVDNC